MQRRHVIVVHIQPTDSADVSLQVALLRPALLLTIPCQGIRSASEVTAFLEEVVPDVRGDEPLEGEETGETFDSGNGALVELDGEEGRSAGGMTV